MNTDRYLKVQFDRLGRLPLLISDFADTADNIHMFRSAKKKKDFQSNPAYLKAKSDYLLSLEQFIEAYKLLIAGLIEHDIVLWDCQDVTLKYMEPEEWNDIVLESDIEIRKLMPDLLDEASAIFSGSLLFDVGFAFAASYRDDIEDNKRKVNALTLAPPLDVPKKSQKAMEEIFKTEVRKAGFKLGYNSKGDWTWKSGTVSNELAILF
jgi:uncharacterized protein YozE (UPF0346 family)